MIRTATGPLAVVLLCAMQPLAAQERVELLVTHVDGTARTFRVADVDVSVTRFGDIGHVTNLPATLDPLFDKPIALAGARPVVWPTSSVLSSPQRLVPSGVYYVRLRINEIGPSPPSTEISVVVP